MSTAMMAGLDFDKWGVVKKNIKDSAHLVWRYKATPKARYSTSPS